MPEEIRTALTDGVMLVEINRPEKKNALTLAMWQSLTVLCTQTALSRQARVVLLTGAGGTFSAGADVSEFGLLRSTEEQVSVYEATVDGALAAIARLPQPTIAAVSGPCFGGGVALAASTDFRVADATAVFSVSAVRMGLAYNVAKCARLAQIVGVPAAKQILLTGGRFGAVQANGWGFVGEIAPGPAIDSALAMAGVLKQGAPLAITAMKRILEGIASGTIAEQLGSLQAMIQAADLSRDHIEAVRAFTERREPVFAGV